MKQRIALLLSVFALAVAITGCSFFPDGGTPAVLDPAQVDRNLYTQIAVPFTAYYEADLALTSENESSYNAAVTTWNTSGSTWDVYQTVAPPYVRYLSLDDNLTDSSREIRQDSVLSWKLFLEENVGAAPDGVFTVGETTYAH